MLAIANQEVGGANQQVGGVGQCEVGGWALNVAPSGVASARTASPMNGLKTGSVSPNGE
jgi:hypothetical protein